MFSREDGVCRLFRNSKLLSSFSFLCSEVQEEYNSIILRNCFNFEKVQINLNLSANHSFLSPFSVVWVKVWNRAGLVWVSLSFPQKCKSGKLQNCCLSPSLSVSCSLSLFVSVVLFVCMHSSSPRKLEAKAGGDPNKCYSDITWTLLRNKIHTWKCSVSI